MPFCQTSKANIYYEIIGTGIPIIMLHGFTPDHRLMKGCMEPVFLEQEGWKRIYFDLPGMGKTTNYSSIQNSDEMLEVVNEFIQALIPDEPYLLVGESYGGYLARGIMRKSAERLLGAAFICPLIIPEKEQRKKLQYAVGSIERIAPKYKRQKCCTFNVFVFFFYRFEFRTWRSSCTSVLKTLISTFFYKRLFLLLKGSFCMNKVVIIKSNLWSCPKIT
ncbi:alpha/beta hydrolase [Lysinibacillus sp. FSL R5-0849]|uniref:alpha/beta fold hydrolase n=1 Tax=Lysinibacillus sp. FSL R5-0849 TaxID=2921660 RepID=UPI003159DB23